MSQLLLILIPILVADILNPILLAGTIYCLGTRHPVINGTAVLGSFLATYFLSGILIAVGLEKFENAFHIPAGFDYLLELIVAALLFYTAWDQYFGGDKHLERRLTKKKDLGFFGAIVLGVQINLIGLPFAVPYLAAVDQILKAEMGVLSILFVLLVYNIAYVLPYFLLIPLRMMDKQGSAALFESINEWMHRTCTKYLPILFAILGLLLVEDAVSYLIGYREYSFLSFL